MQRVLKWAVNNSIVFFQFESTRLRWLEFAHNQYFQLSRLEMPFFALGAFEQDCHALDRERCISHAYPPHGTYRNVDIYGMWAARYEVLTELLKLNLTVVMLDLDQFVHRPFFQYFGQSECMQNVTMGFHIEGRGPNGGFAFARPSPLSIDFFGNVTREFVKEGNGLIMDQTVIQDQWTELAPGPPSMCIESDLRIASYKNQTYSIAMLPSSFIRFGESARDWPASWYLTHMLHNTGSWQTTPDKARSMFSHVARQAWMQLYGYWDPEIFKKYATKPITALHPLLLERVQNDYVVLRQTIQDALLESANCEHAFMLPEIPCNLTWMQTKDPRVLFRDGRCWVGVGDYEFCWPWDYVVYAFDQLVTPKKIINHFTNRTKNEKLEHECYIYFS